MDIFIWAKFSISRSNEKIISSPLVGVWEVGYDFVLSGSRFKVIDETPILQVERAHGIAVLKVGHGNSKVLLPS